jgi:putative glycosyltransferase
MDISIVTTMYNSAPYLEEFYRRICSVTDKITGDYEVVFVNDGSPDDSMDIVKSLYSKDERVRIIDLSKNFGHHKAIMTGLRYTSGDLIFLIDSDLEEAPEVLEIFFKELQDHGGAIDVIYGVQKEREGGWFRRFAGGIYYRIFNTLAETYIPRNTCMVRLMTRRYVDCLLHHEEREIVLSGLFQLTGFSQKAVPITKRYKGTTSYNFIRRVRVFIDSITSFSSRPLVIISNLGLGITLFSVFSMAYLIFQKMAFGSTISGWTSLMGSVWFLGGIIILSVGVVGLYVAKVFKETKRRPRTVIRKVYQRGADEPEERKQSVQKDL